MSEPDPAAVAHSWSVLTEDLEGYWDRNGETPDFCLLLIAELEKVASLVAHVTAVTHRDVVICTWMTQHSGLSITIEGSPKLGEGPVLLTAKDVQLNSDHPAHQLAWVRFELLNFGPNAKEYLLQQVVKQVKRWRQDFYYI